MFSAHHVCGIQVRPEPTLPRRAIVNKTLDGEAKIIASDSRVRRLVPYMSYYHHLSDYNLHPEFHAQVSRIELFGIGRKTSQRKIPQDVISPFMEKSTLLHKVVKVKFFIMDLFRNGGFFSGGFSK